MGIDIHELGEDMKARNGLLVSVLLVFTLIPSSMAQNKWEPEEIEDIFDGFDVSAAIARVEARGVTPYDFGLDLLAAGQPEKAKLWFKNLATSTRDLKYLYGLAWVLRRGGENGKAQSAGKYILENEPTPLIRARVLYLLGAINLDERLLSEARENLQEGLKAYAALEKAGGQFVCLNKLALLAILERKYDEVEGYLEEALAMNDRVRAKGKTPYSLGPIYEVRGESLFGQGDYDGALLMAIDSEKAYREDGEIEVADTFLAKIALLKLITGKPSEARDTAESLWDQFHDSPNHGRLIALNNIVVMKLFQCSEETEKSQKTETSIRSWANSSPGGKAILELMEIITGLPCPEWR